MWLISFFFFFLVLFITFVSKFNISLPRIQGCSLFFFYQDMPMNIVYTVREVNVPAKDSTGCVRNKVAKQSDLQNSTVQNSSQSSIESPCVARTLKNSVQEISTEGALAILPSTPPEVTTPVVSSPPLISPASPSLSSPPLFSPQFFSTPTVPLVPFSPEKCPSNASEHPKSSESSELANQNPTCAIYQATGGQSDSTKSRQCTEINKITKSVTTMDTAIDETLNERSFSQFGKISSPSPPLLELGPSVKKICSASSVSLVSVTKEQGNRSTLSPPLLQAQAASSPTSLPPQYSNRKSSHCPYNSSTQCSSHSDRLLAPQPKNISVTSSHVSTISSPSISSQNPAQCSSSSSVTSIRPSPCQTVTDPSRLMHSVHAILSKSTSRSQSHTPPQSSMPLRWTPVIEHKASPVSTTPQQLPWCVDPSPAQGRNGAIYSNSRDKSGGRHQSDTKNSHGSDSACNVKPMEPACGKQDIKCFSKQSGEVREGKSCVKGESGSTKTGAKKFHMADIKDFSGHSDTNDVQIGVKKYNSIPLQKDIKYGTVKKVDTPILHNFTGSSSSDIKPIKNSLPKREDLINGDSKAKLETKTHLKYDSYRRCAETNFSNCVPQQNFKASSISVKTEEVQPSHNKTASYNSKRADPDRVTELVTNVSSPTVAPSGKEEKNKTKSADCNLSFKLQRLHSHPGQSTEPANKIQEQHHSPAKDQPIDIDAVSSYIPKYQKHKALYLAKRSVSCVEDSTVKTNGNSSQMMEKRNWKKRKLSTLDFDPSSTLLIQKQEKQSPGVAPSAWVTKNGANSGIIGTGDNTSFIACDKSNKPDNLGGSQDRHQCRTEVTPSLFNNRSFKAAKGIVCQSEETPARPKSVLEVSPSTVSCLPMVGRLKTDTRSFSMVSNENISGLIVSDSSYIGAELVKGPAADQTYKNMKMSYPSDSLNSKTCKKDNSKISSRSGDVNSTDNLNNNNNYNSNNNNNNRSNLGGNTMSINDRISKDSNKANVADNVASSPQKQISASKHGVGHGNKFLYGPAVTPHSQDHPGKPGQDRLPLPREKNDSSCTSASLSTGRGAERTTCISVEVPSSSPSDGASTSSSSTSPAADVTSPGTEDRADNSVLLEMQVTPPCVKSYLSSPCSGTKGLPLDLSNRKSK